MDQGGVFNQQSKTQDYSIYSYIKKNPQICKYLAFLINHANSVLMPLSLSYALCLMLISKC